MVDPDRENELRRAIEALYFGYRAFTALPDRMLAQYGLGRTHHRILYFVHRAPEISLAELLAVLSVTKQALHRPIKDLEERGFITLSPDPRDRRVRRLSTTAAGAELEARLTASQMELLDEAFEHAGARAAHDWLRVTELLSPPVPFNLDPAASEDLQPRRAPRADAQQ